MVRLKTNCFLGLIDLGDLLSLFEALRYALCTMCFLILEACEACPNSVFDQSDFIMDAQFLHDMGFMSFRPVFLLIQRRVANLREGTSFQRYNCKISLSRSERRSSKLFFSPSLHGECIPSITFLEMDGLR